MKVEIKDIQNYFETAQKKKNSNKGNKDKIGFKNNERQRSKSSKKLFLNSESLIEKVSVYLKSPCKKRKKRNLPKDNFNLDPINNDTPIKNGHLVIINEEAQDLQKLKDEIKEEKHNDKEEEQSKINKKINDSPINNNNDHKNVPSSSIEIDHFSFNKTPNVKPFFIEDVMQLELKGIAKENNKDDKILTLKENVQIINNINSTKINNNINIVKLPNPISNIIKCNVNSGENENKNHSMNVNQLNNKNSEGYQEKKISITNDKLGKKKMKERTKKSIFCCLPWKKE